MLVTITAALLVALAPLAEDDDLGQVVESMVSAIEQLDQGSYSVENKATGSIAAFMPRTEATVYFKRAEAGGFLGGPTVAHGKAHQGGEEHAVALYYDGTELQMYSAAEQRVVHSSALDHMPMMMQMSGPPLVVMELHDGTTMRMITESLKTRLGPDEQVGTVDCWTVVFDEDDDPDEVAFTMQVAKSDHLPRRIVYSVQAPGMGGESDEPNALVRTIEYGELNGAIDPGVFALRAPEDVAREEWELPAFMRTAAEGGNVGKEFPDFELTDLAGNTHTRESLRGKVLVLDFWATWCKPCLMAMPSVQALHEGLGQRDDVVVLGMNVFEQGGNPAAVVDEKGLTYPNLIGADAVAQALGYQSIPQIVVVGTDGKILREFGGFSPDHATEIEHAVRLLLGIGDGE